MNNSSSTDSEAKHNNKGFEASEFTYIVTFVFGILFLVLSVVVACVRLRVSRGGGGGSTHHNILAILTGIPSRPSRQDDDEIMEEGLRHRTDTSFEGYPKLLYSQVIHQHNKGEGESGSISLCSSNTSCSICLGDYKESDTLRLLPGCGHLYHLACVDPWLRLHSTCPICRKSPLQTQTSSHTTNTTTSTLPT